MTIVSLKQILIDAWRAVRLSYLSSLRDKFGYIHPTAIVLLPSIINKANVYLYEGTNIGEYSNIMANKGRFIMKKNSISGPGLTVICQNHNMYDVGSFPGDENWASGEIASDVIVDEGVWIGANVTLCPGTHIQRGCVIAAGSVCAGKFSPPPYTIVGGNPAKVIKYRFTLEQQIAHENLLYNEDERIDKELLRSYYETFNSRCRHHQE